MSGPGENPVAVSGAFDDIRSPQLRFLHEASRLGPVTVLLWSDAVIEANTGAPPRFPLTERRYFLEAVRYVARVLVVDEPVSLGAFPGADEFRPRVWADLEGADNSLRDVWASRHDIDYQVIAPAQLSGFPEIPPLPHTSGRKKVIVTGCYDWVHSGHVRFLEEVSSYGVLYVVVGHDANIRLLKGDGHPLLPQEERRYLTGSIRYVTESLVSTGDGWLDADPEIQRLKPDIYAVNEDGDKGGKREYCQQRGIEYLVLKRTPAPGLPRRSSTDLRGF